MSRIAAKDRLIVALDMPTIEEAQRLIGELGDSVTFYKVGLELLFAGGLELAHALKADGKHVFLDMKLLDIGNTVERAVANATEFGVDFLTVHGHDLKTLRAAVSGRGNSRLKLLAVTVLTNLTADDLRQQGTALSPSDLVLMRARLAHEFRLRRGHRLGARGGPHSRRSRPRLPDRHPGYSPDGKHDRRPGADYHARPRHRGRRRLHRGGAPDHAGRRSQIRRGSLYSSHPRSARRAREKRSKKAREEPMPKAYVIVRADVTNPEKWAEYVAKSKIALEKFGGRPIVRGGQAKIIEGDGLARNVVLEFDSYEKALGYATSPEYAEAKKLRQGAGTLHMVVVEGV